MKGYSKGEYIGTTRLKILFLLMQDPHLSNRDLAEALGIMINAVHSHLLALKRDGLIDWEDAKARTMQVTCKFIPEDQL